MLSDTVYNLGRNQKRSHGGEGLYFLPQWPNTIIYAEQNM